MIRGIDVTLYEKHKTGEDAFHAPVYEEVPVVVPNVLVGEPDAAAVITELQLHGKRLAYVLAIPKGDTHDWADAAAEFFGQKWHVYAVTEGIEGMIPLHWNRKAMVERYE